MNILFDLDDTLHDKNTSLKKCGDRLFKELNLESFTSVNSFLESFIFENNVIQPKDIAFSKLALKFQMPKSTGDELLDRFNKSFHIDAVLFNGVREMFSYLKCQSVPIGCVTNGRDFFQRNKISSLGLTDSFKSIVTSGEIDIKKPDPRIFLEALSRMNIKPENTVFCGDSIKSDIIPAKELGMITIWKTEKDSERNEVDYKLSNFSFFPQIWQAITK